MKNKDLKKRILAIILCLVMAAGICGTALAEGLDVTPSTDIESQQILDIESDSDTENSVPDANVADTDDINSDANDVDTNDTDTDDISLESNDSSSVLNTASFTLNRRAVVDTSATLTNNDYLDISSFNGACKIYWDEFTSDGPRGSDGDTVASVALGDYSIIREDSDVRTGLPNAIFDPTGYIYGSVGTWKDNSITVDTIYSQDVNDTALLQIVPRAGYFVSRVVVACTPQFNRDGTTPYHCWTWEKEFAYDENLEITASGEVLIDMSVLAFCHLSSVKNGYNTYLSDNYFILIETETLPSPLYVEYDYGDIVENGADAAIFNDPDMWTAADGSNSYGTGSIQTSDTQMKYAYVDSADAATWKHTTNTITQEGTDAAIAVGYRFTGWEAQYYTSVTTEEVADEKGNTFTYTFSETYGDEFNVGAETSVQLATNLRLVAQWEKIPTGDLTIEKEAFVNDEMTDEVFNFLLSCSGLKNQTIDGVQFDEDGNAIVDVASGDSKTVSGLPVGVEILVEEILPDGSDYVARYSVDGTEFQEGKATSITLPNEDDSSVSISFKNEATRTGDLVISKIAEINGVIQEGEFHFEVTSADLANKTFGEGTDAVSFNENGVATVSVNSNSSKTISGLPAGVELTVKEIDYGEYEVSYTVGDDVVQSDTATVIIEKDKIKTIAFQNMIETGELLIQKDVYINGTKQNNTGAVFQFELTSDALAGKTFGDIQFDEDGKANITVNAGEAKSVSGLPVGVQIKIVEMDYAGYTPKVSLYEEQEFQNSDEITVTVGSLENDGITTVYYRNEMSYALPSTGGPGIYLYLIVGVVLLMSGSTVVYKRKCEEVLRRR